MAKKISRNAPCPCGSGRKYKQCCINKDFEWHETDDGRIARSVPVSKEMSDLLDELRQSYIAKHGREPEQIFEDAPPLEVVEHLTVEAMKKADVEPALIHAYIETGLMLNERNENKTPVADIEEWEAVIDAYERKTGTKATRRRFVQADLDGILENGPKEPTRRWVTKLPLPPPFTREEWAQRHLSDVVNDPRCMDYLQRCLNEVKRSGRAGSYISMFNAMAHLRGTERKNRNYEAAVAEAQNRMFTIEELCQALEAVVESFKPKGAIPNAAAAFEILTVIGDFMNHYCEHVGTDELANVLTRVNGLGLVAFGVAVNVELGTGDDIWKA